MLCLTVPECRKGDETCWAEIPQSEWAKHRRIELYASKRCVELDVGVIADPELLAEAKKKGLDVTPARGEDLEALIKDAGVPSMPSRFEPATGRKPHEP